MLLVGPPPHPTQFYFKGTQEETDTGPDHLQAECPIKCNAYIFLCLVRKHNKDQPYELQIKF